MQGRRRAGTSARAGTDGAGSRGDGVISDDELAAAMKARRDKWRQGVKDNTDTK